MTVVVNTGEDERGKIFAMDNDFRKIPGVKIVGTGNSYPGSANSNLNLFIVQTNTGTVNKAIESYNIDEKFPGLFKCAHCSRT